MEEVLHGQQRFLSNLHPCLPFLGKGIRMPLETTTPSLLRKPSLAKVVTFDPNRGESEGACSQAATPLIKVIYKVDERQVVLKHNLG